MTNIGQGLQSGVREFDVRVVCVAGYDVLEWSCQLCSHLAQPACAIVR